MTHHYRIILHSLLLISITGNLIAQKKPLDVLNNIFKKKGNTTTQTSTTTQSTNTSSNRVDPKLILNNIAPDAKYLDVERWYTFNNGAAVIGKGSATALIDSKGNFIIPYNVDYHFFPEATESQLSIITNPVAYRNIKYFNNIFYVLKTPTLAFGGYLTSNGKWIVSKDINASFLLNYTENKRYIEASQTKRKNTNNGTVSYTQYTYYGIDGSKHIFDERLSEINEGIGIIRPNGSSKSAYYTLKGQKLTDLIFDEAYPFVDDMAIVGVKDQFGQTKYGFINSSGKLVIPCTFSNIPTSFSGEYAKVKPKDAFQAGFEYAFIDKQGNVLMKQTKEDVTKYGTFGSFTSYGLAFSSKYILDNKFQITPKTDFFKKYNIPSNSYFASYSDGEGYSMEGETNPKIYYGNNSFRDPFTPFAQPLIGFINLATGKVIPPVYTKIGLFDPVSHLAYAETITGLTTNNTPITRTGFINEDGQFVLLKGTTSTW